MDEAVARELLRAEREQVERLLAEVDARSVVHRASDEDPGSWSDSAQPLTAEEADDEVRQRLRERLAAISRAESRLAAGTYGLSVRSGEPIPDERLEADPAAELTVMEAAAVRR